MESTIAHLTVKRPLRCLVTGTGRCGTVSMARFLSAHGMPCGHESIFDTSGFWAALQRLTGEAPPVLSLISQIEKTSDGFKPLDHWLDGVNELEAESSYMAAPFLDHAELSATKIIHLVRHPMSVVNSFLFGINYFGSTHSGYESYIYSVLPSLLECEHPEDRAALYYVLWNELIESKLASKSARLFRIEDDPAVLLEFLDLPPDDRVLQQSNKWAGTKLLTVEQIRTRSIRSRLIEMGRRYGYHLGSSKLFL